MFSSVLADLGVLVARCQGLLSNDVCSIVLTQVDSHEVTFYSLDVDIHFHNQVLYESAHLLSIDTCVLPHTLQQ